MSQAADDPVQAGREAIKRHAWREAFDYFRAAAPSSLIPSDYAQWAEAAWWTGRLDECIAAREHAHNGFLEQGNRRGAGVMAAELAHDPEVKHAFPIAAAWNSKTERVLGEEAEISEQGILRPGRQDAA